MPNCTPSAPRSQAPADAFAAEYGGCAQPTGTTAVSPATSGCSPMMRWTWSTWPPRTPSTTQIVLAALQAGKHVLCEKALTINAREAAELVELAREPQPVPDGSRVEPVPARACSGPSTLLRPVSSERSSGSPPISAFPRPLLPHRPALGTAGRRRSAAGPDRLPAAVGAGNARVSPDRQRHRHAQRRRRRHPERTDARLQPRRPGPADVIAAGTRTTDRHRCRKPGLPPERRVHQQPPRTDHRQRLGRPPDRNVRRRGPAATPTNCAR